MPVKIFFCYAHEDELLLNKLKTHLRPMQRMGLIETWHDRDISAGMKWEEEINTHLNEANIILLLVSPDFIDSDYCYGKEMQRALERDQRGEARVIPIILHPVYWQDVLGTLQALPTDGNPVMSSSWQYEDEAFFNVTEGIRKVVMQLTPPALASPAVPEESQQELKRPSVFPSTVQPRDNVSPLTTLSVSPAVSSERHQEMTIPSTLTLAFQQGKNVSPFLSPFAVEKLALLYTLTGHSGTVSSVALSADGQTLVSASSHEYTIKVWNLSNGRLVGTLTGHTGAVYCVALSADGQTLVSASEDETIKVWNLSTGQEVRTLKSHTGAVYSVALSADGQTLVSVSFDKTIKVWRA